MKSLRLTATFVVIGLFLIISVAVGAKRSISTEQEPAVVSAVAPSFSSIALAARVASGNGIRVIVEVKIDAKGTVTSAEVESGHPLFKDISIFAAKRWRFAESTDTKASRTAHLIFIFIEINDKPKKGEPDELVTFTPSYQVEVRRYFELEY
jgi:hypothetical protein